jgi:hypothetical protein
MNRSVIRPKIGALAFQFLIALAAALPLSFVTAAATPSGPEEVAVSSRVGDVRIAASRVLPAARGNEPLSDFCGNYVIKPKTTAGRAAAKRGWHVTSELAFGPYVAVGIFSESEPGTGSTCLIKDGNIVVYGADRLVAIVYARRASEEGSAGIIASVDKTTLPDTVRILPGSVGSPTADLSVTSEGLAVTEVAAEDPACDGRVRVPNVFDLTIAQARAKLGKAGWKPVPPGKEEREADPTLDIAAGLRQSGFEEVHECSGTGFGFCGLEYRHASGATLYVTTADDPPSVLSVEADCSPKR